MGGIEERSDRTKKQARTRPGIVTGFNQYVKTLHIEDAGVVCHTSCKSFPNMSMLRLDCTSKRIVPVRKAGKIVEAPAVNPGLTGSCHRRRV